MSEPYFWIALAVVAMTGLGARLVARRPLWLGRSSALHRWEWVMAGASMAALVFHCMAMFFPSWVEGVPLLRTPSASVRSLGLVSQVAYWVPALGAVVAVRRLWRPALGALSVALLGVGVTMFLPFRLVTHLAWIAVAVTVIVAISSALLALPRRSAAGS